MAQNDGEKLITIRSNALPVDPKEAEERSRRFAKELVAKLVDVAGAVKQIEAACNVEEVARETGLPERTIRAWRVKLSGSGAGKGRV